VKKNVVVAMALCNRQKAPFGIRFEEKASAQWFADWAFELKQGLGQREGYDQTQITGQIVIEHPAYPGCPHCKAGNLFKCGCEALSCWPGEQRNVTCPSCGNTSKIEGTINSLSSQANY